MNRRVVLARLAVRVLAVALVIVASALLWHRLPAPTQIFAPFDVRGSVGERVVGRPIAVTVTGLRVAPDVTVAPKARNGKRIHAAGTWVVVETTMEALRDPVTAEAELLVDGNSYHPSERFILQNFSSAGSMNPGIPERGTWVFDVATNLVDGPAPFVLRLWTGDGRLDSRLVISIGKSEASRQDVVALTRPRIGT